MKPPVPLKGASVPDFVGGDPESNANECPAVWIEPQTGDFLFRGKTAHIQPERITAALPDAELTLS